ncbi:hypothetical protein FRC11_001304 [Ceratobasidium sp. 423]|nr:hypothetical protein FRC11_001304 [Ceratobasidium sp. 423]
MEDDMYNEFIDWVDNTNKNFGHLTILHLRGLFPLWESTAYHNLVDLRLITSCDEHWTCIREQELRGILAASPGLRILHFALQITDLKGDDESIIPVRLNDLEVVSVSSDRGGHNGLLRPGDVLRLLAPGSKPLLLSIWHTRYAPDEGNTIGGDDYPSDEVIKFFQRSNITKFHVKGIYYELNQLIGHAPNIEDLAFDSCTLVKVTEKFPPGGIPIASRLNSLIIRHCTMQRPLLEVILRVYPTNLLVVSDCDLAWFDYPINGDDIPRLLKVLKNYPNTRLEVYENPVFDPIATWDVIA